MNDLVFHKNYKENQVLRGGFNRLAQETFSIDFEAWYQKGCWGDTYTCYTYFDGDMAVANLSTTTLVLKAAGKEYEAVQIGTVMTDPGFRNQGLNKALMDKAMADHGDKTYFLFANPSAKGYYEKVGFKPYIQEVYELAMAFVPSMEKQPHRKLKMHLPEDRELLMEASLKRQPLTTLDVYGGESIMFWYCVNFYHNHIYYHEPTKTIMIGFFNEEAFELFLLINPTKLSLEGVFSLFLNQSVSMVRFHFAPDDDRDYIIKEDEEPIYIKGPWDIDKVPKYPSIFTA